MTTIYLLTDGRRRPLSQVVEIHRACVAWHLPWQAILARPAEADKILARWRKETSGQSVQNAEIRAERNAGIRD